jgi:hypothetical protein
MSRFIDGLYSRALVETLRRRNSRWIEVFRLASSPSALTVLADKYGSDKGSAIEATNKQGWPSHSYTEVYDRWMSERRQDVKYIFECGIGTNNPELVSTMGIKGSPGASLRMWRDYFPSATVIGVDIDPSILFEEERIHTFSLDQTKKDEARNLFRKLNLRFDLIIDDGLHTFQAGASLFEAAIDYLAPNGRYVIEDVSESDALKFQKYFASSPLNVELLRIRRGGHRIGDNQLICITLPNQHAKRIT